MECFNHDFWCPLCSVLFLARWPNMLCWDKKHIPPNSIIPCLCWRGENNLQCEYWYCYLRISSPAEDPACRSRSLCHWPHVSAARQKRWPGGCYCTTMWWAGGEEDACSVRKPLDGSDPYLKKDSKLMSGPCIPSWIPFSQPRICLCTSV